ncbi:hypothetical protein AB0J86_19445 [Micromonospora sp. NPDC049559]|uniref:hypothetical protein n=1 Tax=Micromonospora sp. NPDC049559 TaxID=3155923 RepID=UPI0034238E6E
MDRPQRRPLALFVALAGILALLGAGAVAAQAARKSPPRTVRTSVGFDQVYWQRVPGLAGNTCVKTELRGRIEYEYSWRLGPMPHPGRPQKTRPALNKLAVVAPQVVVSAWTTCSASGRRPLRVSGVAFEQRWLNADGCGLNGLSLGVAYPPFAVQAGTTISCGETSYIGRKSSFSKDDNDYQESNSNVRINIANSGLKWTENSRGIWGCARAEVGGRVVKSNRNDTFGHVFYPCVHLPAERVA